MAKAKAAPAAPQPLISDKRLQQLYVTLLAGRALRQQMKVRQRPAWLVAPEAIATGTVTHLEEEDALMAPPGDAMAALARGCSLHRVLSGATLKGMLPANTSAPTRFAMAAGYALSQQNTKQQRQPVTMVLSGPGITSLAELAPALAYAAANRLGVVFVIQTAADADVSGPRHTGRLGLPGIPVDGNDVIALYRVTQEAVTRARRAGGPTLIDCKPWPVEGKADPVRRLEEALERRGIPVAALQKRSARQTAK